MAFGVGGGGGGGGGARVGNEPSEPSDEQDFTSRASEDLPELAARRKL